MKYLALIYTEESREPPEGPERDALFGAYFKFNEEAGAAGVLVGGNALLPTTMATTVSVRDGEKIVTDGPFAETREALGGYYMLECDNLDIALEWAAKIPSATFGRIEVRPVMQIEGDHS